MDFPDTNLLTLSNTVMPPKTSIKAAAKPGKATKTVAKTYKLKLYENSVTSGTIWEHAHCSHMYISQ